MAADNLGSHLLGGFKAPSRSLRFCRQCMAILEDIRLKVNSDIAQDNILCNFNIVVHPWGIHSQNKRVAYITMLGSTRFVVERSIAVVDVVKYFWPQALWRSTWLHAMASMWSLYWILPHTFMLLMVFLLISCMMYWRVFCLMRSSWWLLITSKTATLI